MTPPALTAAEARVLFTVLNNTWIPRYAPEEFKSGVAKLCAIGGNAFCCRDCSEKGTLSSRFGGFVCAKHQAAEDEIEARAIDAKRDQERATK